MTPRCITACGWEHWCNKCESGHVCGTPCDDTQQQQQQQQQQQGGLMATPTPVEILRIPLISTVHQPSSLCWHEQDIFPVVNTETGTMVLFVDDLDPFVTLPRWLWTLSTWATDNGFTWVWFDADARPVDALPTYDWTED